jgi:hypothetical protein
MSAPLPLRFYNPVKTLCKKANLDYDTVLANTITDKTIMNAFINAEIDRPIEFQKPEDRQKLKKQKEYYYSKNGERFDTERNAPGNAEDKGRLRYDAGITVEYVCADDSKMDESTTSQDSNGVVQTYANGFSSKDASKYLRRGPVWTPGGPSTS